MALNFEWHVAKARSNISKHGVSFDNACLAFSDPYYRQLPRRDNGDEERSRIVALAADRLLFIVYTWRGRTIRLISAREATRNESLGYWKNRHFHARS